jgi:hypothetical protein
MFELATQTVVAAELRESRAELDFARHRVAAQSAPDGGSSGWVGPAGWAYRRALALLSRDLDAAVELLRSASELTSAALYQLGHDD